MQATIAAATETVADIDKRFKAGDPAADALDRLRTLLTTLVERAPAVGAVPPEMRSQIVTLLSALDATVAAGTDWLTTADQELASHHARHRLRRAYGVP